jgi:hypothetical protein
MSKKGRYCSLFFNSIQNLSLSYIFVQEVIHVGHVCVYNFTIYYFETNEGPFNSNHEEIARRGLNEL